MNDSTLIFFRMKAQTYEKFKSLKNNEMFKSLDENDFLMYIFNKVAEDTNLIPSMKKDDSNILDSRDFHHDTEIPTFVSVKAENVETTDSNNHGVQSSADIHTYQCTDHQPVFQFDVELKNRNSSDHEIKTNQYKCSCGTSFHNLQLFLQHNIKCINVTHKVKDEPKNQLKRYLSDIKTNEIEIKHDYVANVTENNCEDCNRNFRTSCSLYLHQCNKKIKVESKSDYSQMEMPDVETFTSSNQHEKKKHLSMTQRPVLICHCLLEFYDHNEFFKHSKNCGKPNPSEKSHSGYNNKKSSLNVMPNTDGKYECVDCNKSFTSMLSLRQHSDGMHRDTPKYVCDKCGKGYWWCASFHYHKKYKCIK